ncbi:hypothetical protein KEM55_004072 [Ascosphaera atra]|nr:hypothetical protein KEM55_004072 [Ascosphaera atra]
MTPPARAAGIPSKVVIFGAGNVGAATAFAMLMQGLPNEIVLVDIDKARCEGQVMDMNHAAPFTSDTQIRTGEYADCKDAAIIVFAAGKGRQPGQSRLDLLKANTVITRDVITEVVKYTQDSIIIMATNPVDVLTWVAWKASGYPAERVIGSGTSIDTARLRVNIGRSLNIDPQSVQIDIVGEHGDSELAVWSCAHIAGVPIEEFCQRLGMPDHVDELKRSVFEKTKEAGYEIIKRKGLTEFAIAGALTRLVEAVLRDKNTIATVCTAGTYGGVENSFISSPKRLNRDGAHSDIPWSMNGEEEKKYKRAAETVAGNIEEIKW